MKSALSVKQALQNAFGSYSSPQAAQKCHLLYSAQNQLARKQLRKIRAKQAGFSSALHLR